MPHPARPSSRRGGYEQTGSQPQPDLTGLVLLIEISSKQRLNPGLIGLSRVGMHQCAGSIEPGKDQFPG
jgi:hypothetical protein